MAISQDLWLKAKEYFEAGLSLTDIVDRTGISKSQISKRASKENWEKGTKEIILKEVKIVPKAGIVYVIRAGKEDYYKIGITCDDMEYRLKSLQTGNHLKLEVINLYYSDNVYLKEKELHTRYKKYNTVGEWFKLTDGQIIELKKELSNG